MSFNKSKASEAKVKAHYSGFTCHNFSLLEKIKIAVSDSNLKPFDADSLPGVSCFGLGSFKMHTSLVFACVPSKDYH